MINAPPGSVVRFRVADTAPKSRVAVVTPDGCEHPLIYVKRCEVSVDADHGVRARVELLEREGEVFQNNAALERIEPAVGAVDVLLECVDFVPRKWWGAVPA